MSDLTETSQRLAPPLLLPASRVVRSTRHREVASESWESVWAWTRFAAAGIVIAWLLSMGAFGTAAPKASAADRAPARAASGDGPPGYFPAGHRDAPLVHAEHPATF
jgi:hypothetical protein